MQIELKLDQTCLFSERLTQENARRMHCGALRSFGLLYVQIVHNWWMWKERVINEPL